MQLKQSIQSGVSLLAFRDVSAAYQMAHGKLEYRELTNIHH